MLCEREQWVTTEDSESRLHWPRSVFLKTPAVHSTTSFPSTMTSVLLQDKQCSPAFMLAESSSQKPPETLHSSFQPALVGNITNTNFKKSCQIQVHFSEHTFKIWANVTAEESTYLNCYEASACVDGWCKSVNLSVDFSDHLAEKRGKESFLCFLATQFESREPKHASAQTKQPAKP